MKLRGMRSAVEARETPGRPSSAGSMSGRGVMWRVLGTLSPAGSVRSLWNTPSRSCEHAFAFLSMTPFDERTQLLSFCAVDGANWHVIAREAQSPGGVARLAAGELAEKSKEATETRRRLQHAAETARSRCRPARQRTPRSWPWDSRAQC